jgi:hypothetical protein
MYTIVTLDTNNIRFLLILYLPIFELISVTFSDFKEA